MKPLIRQTLTLGDRQRTSHRFLTERLVEAAHELRGPSVIDAPQRGDDIASTGKQQHLRERREVFALVETSRP